MSDMRQRLACDRALRRLADGDTEALGIIYEQLGRRIYLYALSILRDTHAAEDILQDTLLRLTGGARHYRPDSNAIAFILTVTRNLALNALERRARELPDEHMTDGSHAALASLTTPAEPPPAMAELAVLDQLDTDERQLVLLRLEYGMKHRDLAALLGISRTACEKKYSRAVEKMRAYYAERHVTKDRKEQNHETQETLS